jgi:hypothetical protein
MHQISTKFNASRFIAFQQLCLATSLTEEKICGISNQVNNGVENVSDRMGWD